MLRWFLLLSFTLLCACEQTTVTPEKSVPEVTVKPWSEVQQPYYYSAPAQVISLNDSQLSAEITARVIAIPVAVGAEVKRGQTLLKLDCTAVEQKLKQEKASLDSLQAKERLEQQRYERVKTLLEKQTVSKETLDLRASELDASIAEREAQKARVAIAANDVANCVIKAPFSGVIAERFAQLGQIANTGTPVLRIVDLEQLEISAQILAEDAPILQAADTINLSYADQTYPLKLRAIAAVVDERTLTREARLEFSGQSVPPGSIGRLQWSNPKPSLPASLLSRRDGQLGVLLASDNKVVFQVIPDAEEGRPALLELPATAAIIIDGRLPLQPGDTIKIRE